MATSLGFEEEGGPGTMLILLVASFRILQCLGPRFKMLREPPPVSGAPAKQVNTTAGGKYLVEDLIRHASHFPLPNIIQYYSVPSSTLTSLHSRYLDGPPCQNDITALQHRSFSATRNSRKRRVDVPGVVATSAKI